MKLIHGRAIPSRTLNATIPGQYPEARTSVAAPTEATTGGKRIHCSRKLAAPTRMGTTHTVSILTRGGDTTPITSVREGTPAGISNIARITSVSMHTSLVITLITSVIEGLSRDSSIASLPCLPSIATGRHGSTPTLNRAVTQDLAHHSTLDKLTMHNTARHHQTAHWATHPAVCCRIAPTPIQMHLPV